MVEAKAETAGRTKAEEKIVKSITEVITRIDARKGRRGPEGETLRGQEGGLVGSKEVPQLETHRHGRSLEVFPFQTRRVGPLEVSPSLQTA